MRTVSVCVVMSYNFEAEIPDDMFEVDEDGYLKNEADIIGMCITQDPLEIGGDVYGIIKNVANIYDNSEFLYQS